MPRLAPRAWTAAILAGWLIAGLSGPAPAAGEDQRAADQPTLHQVVIEGFRFLPAELEIRPGDSVEWVNRDLAPHTATARNGAWDSGNLPRGTDYRQPFNAPGSFDYFCAFHPAMSATITVAAP